MEAHSFLFFSNATAPTEIYTLSLHDALPITKVPLELTSTRTNLSRRRSMRACSRYALRTARRDLRASFRPNRFERLPGPRIIYAPPPAKLRLRSEEHGRQVHCHGEEV